jgi:hypothetical protein
MGRTDSESRHHDEMANPTESLDQHGKPSIIATGIHDGNVSSAAQRR